MIFLQYTFRAFCGCDFFEKSIINKKYIHIYIEEMTCTKATRCETLRTIIQQTASKTLILTYCLNASLIVDVSDLFWYITSYIAYEVLKWALEMGHLNQKWTHSICFISQPFLLILHYELSILIIIILIFFRH